MQATATIENNIEIALTVNRGRILKCELAKSIGASSMKVLRGDVTAYCETPENEKAYQPFEKKHFVSVDFAKKLIVHLFGECKIILKN
jgi:hypothetical protein